MEWHLAAVAGKHERLNGKSQTIMGVTSLFLAHVQTNSWYESSDRTGYEQRERGKFRDSDELVQ